MRSGTIAFFLGILGMQALTTLPDVRLCWLLPVFLVMVWRVRPVRLPALCAVGALWVLWRAHLILAQSLPTELEGKTVTIEGTVVGLPDVTGGRVRFNFATDSLMFDGQYWPSCGRIRLDWRGEVPAPVHARERWRLEVRLKRPHGLRNPGGFDYEGWQFQHRIRATGYVVSDGTQLRLAHPERSVDTLRERVRLALQEAIGEHRMAGIVTALAIGARDGISPEQWNVFFRTNTGHLIAISGLHIGLIAGFGFFLGRWLWSLPARTLLWIPAPKVAAVSGWVAACGYSALAGFEVPAQRTLIMIGVVMFSLWMNRRVAAIDSLLAALAVVLLVDPIAVLSVGFWLSFLAVGILLYSTGGPHRDRGLWAKLGRAHVAMAIGLAPILIFLFEQSPLVGPVANFVAVPWVSFIVVPLVLLGTLTQTVVPLLGYWFLRAALLALELLWELLSRLSTLDFAIIHIGNPGKLVLVCALLGAAILLMPRGLPGRTMGLLWIAPLVLHQPPRPGVGEAWLTVLDVGQGLAAVVRTHNHALVFDTGPSYGERFDTGAAVVAPYLWHEGIRRVDRLLVSHGDIDHIGGVRSLLDKMFVGDVLSSVPSKIDHPRVTGCAEGQSWRWDEVDFLVLNPPPAGASSDNNASCVLHVRAWGGSLLLTGDIEQDAEQRLVAGHPAAIRADVLVAPHHGSKSSSTAPFIEAVAPRYVIYPVGYRNRWDFPSLTVQRRYSDLGARQLRSDAEGAVTFRIASAVSEPESYRRTHRRYWHGTYAGFP